jgi:hypothetical protein
VLVENWKSSETPSLLIIMAGTFYHQNQVALKALMQPLPPEEKSTSEFHLLLKLPIELRHRLVNGFGKTGFYRPTALLVKPYINLAVTVPNHLFFIKTSIFKYFKDFFLSIFYNIKALYSVLRPRLYYI